MGRDKALLPFGQTTLLESVALAVGKAAGQVTIVGSPEKYSALGLRVIPDLRPGCGPLAGIEAALADSRVPWIVIAACDMPFVSAEFFRRLLEAREPGVAAVIPFTPDGLIHPLAAAYHTSAQREIATALDGGVRKVVDALKALKVNRFAVEALPNANTPEEWAALVR
jgi:molybdopterin-guanine dinucleotide biosynthesis protein A